MGILENITAKSITARWLPDLNQAKPKCLVVDANWTGPTLHTWLRAGKTVGALTAFEPVSTAKATRLFTPSPDRSEAVPVFPNHLVDLATPNTHELSSLHSTATRLDLFSRSDWWRVIDSLGIPSSGLRVALSITTSSDLVDQGLPQQSIQLLPFIPTILTKLGPRGVLLTMLLKANDPRLSSPEASPYVLSRCSNGDPEIGGIYVRLFEPEEVLGPGEVISVNGVGDTFLGALVAGISRGRRIEDVVNLAQRAAVFSLKGREAVSPELVTLRAKA
jgi:pseudouridylate synthase / pseudouridine kinase